MGMKAKYGPADYEARLNGGVVLWKGIPHKVQVDGHQININDLITGRAVERNIEPLDDNLDISSPELGFINGEYNAYYLMRVPLRKYRQTLEQNAIFESILQTGGFYNEHGGRGSVMLYTKYFRDSYTNNYPSFDEAVKLLTDEKMESVALNRHVAITLDPLGIVKVWYRMGDQPVGWVEPGGHIIKVPESDKGWVISLYLEGFGWEVQ